jgi:hypothetical protein
MYADPYADPAAPTYVPTYEVGRSSKFKQLNCCALYLAVTIFALLIAAATVCWYSYDDSVTGVDVPAISPPVTYTVSYTRECYDLEGVTSTMKATSSSTETSTFKQYQSSTSVWSVFKLCQAFVLIGLLTAALLSFFLVLCFANALRNKLLFLLGMNVLRIVLFLIAALILISVIIAFLGFLGITTAFNDDTPSCVRGTCQRFSDSVKTTLPGTTSTQVAGVARNLALTQSTSWGAHAGWFLVLACIPLAIFLAIIVVLNKFPIPVDSVGSGEAL